MWGLIPMPWRLIGAGVLVALIGWAALKYRASLIEEGMRRGRLEQIKADETRMKSEQEAAQAEIDGLRSALQISESQNAAERAQLRLARTDLYKNLDEKLAAIAAGREVCDAGIAAIPGDRLDDVIRAELSRLGEPGGAAIPSGSLDPR